LATGVKAPLINYIGIELGNEEAFYPLITTAATATGRGKVTLASALTSGQRFTSEFLYATEVPPAVTV
jgi:hypothetical protein